MTEQMTDLPVGQISHAGTDGFETESQLRMNSADREAKNGSEMSFA
jgi:hypothetical protein